MLEIQAQKQEENGPPSGKFVRTKTCHGRPIHLSIVRQSTEKQDLAIVDPEPEGYNPYDHSPPPPPECVDPDQCRHQDTDSRLRNIAR